jgi:hypothetical protein
LQEGLKFACELISNNQTSNESPSTPPATTATAVDERATFVQDASTNQNGTVITEGITVKEQEEHVSDPSLETNHLLQGMLQVRLFPLTPYIQRRVIEPQLLEESRVVRRSAKTL